METTVQTSRVAKDLAFTCVRSLEQAIAMEDRNQILCVQSKDVIEGMTAFLQKRKPDYTGH